MFAAIWRLKWVILGIVLLVAAAWYWWTNIREPDWRAAAIEDVNFIRNTIASDHPGPYDTANPDFANRLEESHTRALELAGQVEGPAGYFYATRAMTAAFEDAHLATQYTRAMPRVRQYPGFFLALDGDDAVRVAQVDGDQAPPLGARLLSCEGMAVGDLYDSRVAPYTHNSWLSGQMEGNMPWILIDPGNPFLSQLESCQFAEDGAPEPVTYQLSWQPLDNAARSEYFDQIEPRISQETALSFPAGDLAWVSIASFSDSGVDVSEELAALISDIEQQRGRIAGSQALVIDVRGNLGGSSAAGYKVAGSLWGSDYVNARLPTFDTTDWRASAANLERLDDAMLPMRIKFGSDSELFQKVSAIRDGMEEARRADVPFFVQANPDNRPSNADALPLPERIYLLTDSLCVSACLDFVDLVVTLPNVTHVGRETAGDTRYLEVVSVEMPSGLGNLVYPTAIHRGRERGDNASYTPAIRFDGDIADKDALSQWLLAGAPTEVPEATDDLGTNENGPG